MCFVVIVVVPLLLSKDTTRKHTQKKKQNSISDAMDSHVTTQKDTVSCLTCMSALIHDIITESIPHQRSCVETERKTKQFTLPHCGALTAAWQTGSLMSQGAGSTDWRKSLSFRPLCT